MAADHLRIQDGKKRKTEMISVIIPTHNRRELLARAVGSVRRQTVKDLEIIVVSDGSSDDTAEYLQSLSREESRLSFYIYEESRGANYARNLGIKKAEGEYLAFLDDDDEWIPEKLELQQRILDSDASAGLVYTHIDVVDRNAVCLWVNRCMVEGDALREALFGGFIFTTSSVMLRKSVAEKAGLFDESLPAMQDLDMWIRCCQITKVRVVPEVLTRYYIYSFAENGSGRDQIGNSTQRYLEAVRQMEMKYEPLYRRLTAEENRERKSIIMAGLSDRAKRNHEKKLMRFCAEEALKNRLSRHMMINYLISFLPGESAFIREKLIFGKMRKART